MDELPEEERRLISKRTDEVAKVIDALVAQLDITPEEEMFAREQSGRVFALLTDAYLDAYPSVKRKRCATAAAVIAFKSIQVWAEHDDETA